ncbi:hypothetical protein AWB77_04820 [Caballeronia fortuita]|uniref:Uncharacterized protein n=1 Tax=Caballeronia fortuita TaxID=1777138 RepID=A0A158D4P0_9BURK|nr:hypothetical protein [Caballeronia fortuita]SAK88787.1 hypothetical protein AWB77_04820 [Caballeronia fortuita]
MGKTCVFKRSDSFDDRARSQDGKYVGVQEALEPEAERRRVLQRRHAAILAIQLFEPIRGLSDPEASTQAGLTRVKVFPPATWRELGAVPALQVLWRLEQATPDQSNERQFESRRFHSKIALAGPFPPRSPTQVDRVRPRSPPVRVRNGFASYVPGSTGLRGLYLDEALATSLHFGKRQVETDVKLPPGDHTLTDGKSVVVFDVGGQFRGGRDITVAVDAAIAKERIDG